MTKTPSNPLTPSISVRIWHSTRSDAVLELLPRLTPMLSISSKKMMDGAACLAFSNTLRMAFSLSPTYFDSNSGPWTAMKLILASLAHALAIIVFEHPGGPNIRIPFGGLSLNISNNSGLSNGNIIESYKVFFASSYP